MNNIYEILEKNPVVLAPMAGFTDYYYRESVRENSQCLAFTEMVSAKALCFNDKKTYSLLKTSKTDSPLSVQIFGHEPDIMAEAAVIIKNLGFEMLDINCGCPAPKVYKNGDGSSLMLNPHLIYNIVHSIKKAVDITLSVKLRVGYDLQHDNVVKCALMCQEGGADFVTVHGRTRDMQYGGKCMTEYIKAVKDNLYIPVIGNGDVKDRKSYLDLRKKTGCDGVMVGRASLGNPFIIKEITEQDFTADKNMGIKAMYSHIEKICSDENNVKNVRALMLYYMNHFGFGRDIKLLCSQASTLLDVEKIVDLCLK